MQTRLEGSKIFQKFSIVVVFLMFLIPDVSSSQETISTPHSTVGTELNVIESIGFEAKDGVGIVSIEAEKPLNYEQIPDEKGRLSIRLKDVALAQKFQISRDVTDYNSPISFVSSFRDPVKESDVLIVIDFKEDDVEHDLIKGADKLTINFQKAVLDKQEKLARQTKEELWAFDFRFVITPGALKKYKGELISIDFKGADIIDVLRILSDIGGFNIVVARDVKGTVTIKLDEVPWDQALDIVLEDGRLGGIVEGNILKIAPLGTLQARQRALRVASQSKEEFEPLITKQVFISYATAEGLQSLASPLLSSRGEMRIDVRTNSILITDIPGRVAEVTNLLRDLDTRTPQVFIESRIVQATLDFTRQLGVQWGLNYRATAATGNPTGAVFPSSVQVGGTNTGSPFGTAADGFIVDLPAAAGSGAGAAVGILLGSITGAYDLDLRLSALESRGDGRILSSPKVLTMNNNTARIEQGVSIPFLSRSENQGTQVQFVDATLRLEVTPQVTNDDRVLMNIKVTDNAPDISLTGAGGQPSIRRSEAETQALAGDGETIVIGGIFTKTVTEGLSSVPWFSRIPLFGWLFQSTDSRNQRRELIVFITPRIIR